MHKLLPMAFVVVIACSGRGADATDPAVAAADVESPEVEVEVVDEVVLGCPEGMVFLPPGTFRMGCPGTEDLTACDSLDIGHGCNPDEAPAHDVTLSAFCIDRTEVTTVAYAECMADAGTCAVPNDYTMHHNCNWDAGKVREGREQHPANCISWVDAEAYCRWRTGCEGIGCGLPSEAQWEYAARGPGATPRTYPWGETPPDCTVANFGIVKGEEGAGQCVGHTQPVCTTPLGNTPGTDLCDMGGNVWELTRDYYSPSFYCLPEASVANPLNTTESELVAQWEYLYPPSPKMALRGGSFYDDCYSSCARGSMREYFGRLERASSLGIRCVASPARVVAPPRVTVPAATFQMGCTEGHDACVAARYYDLPVHTVNVPAFEMDRFETTVARFASCVDAGACEPPTFDSKYCNWGKPGKEQHPMNCIDWGRARAFCAWDGGRLCTEAEWERAARGTDGRKWPWGNEVATCERAVMASDEGDVYGCGTDSTLPVGSRPAGVSADGVHDLAGNVWEWVEDADRVGVDWPYEGAPTDGSAAVDESSTDRVARGGGFVNVARFLVSWVHLNFDKTNSSAYYLGLRCCRSL